MYVSVTLCTCSFYLSIYMPNLPTYLLTYISFSTYLSIYLPIYVAGDVIVSDDQSPSWVLCLIVHGNVKLKPKNAFIESQSRGPSTYVLADELTKLHSRLDAVSEVKMALLPRKAYEEVLGALGT